MSLPAHLRKRVAWTDWYTQFASCHSARHIQNTQAAFHFIDQADHRIEKQKGRRNLLPAALEDRFYPRITKPERRRMP